MEKLTLEERKILAMVECMLLWDLLASGKFLFKQDAIDYLFENESINEDIYDAACPFCEYLYDNKRHCYSCLWPGMGASRCTDPDSPFYIWNINKTTKNAQAVFDMLKLIEF